MADGQVFATKGNLISIKKSLRLAQTGFELLDRKNNILIRETMSLIDEANVIQSSIDAAYSKAYKALMAANVTLGIVDDAAALVPIETGLQIDFRSVMGVEVPTVRLNSTVGENYYGYLNTSTTSPLVV